jgi:hypothetical protein
MKEAEVGELIVRWFVLIGLISGAILLPFPSYYSPKPLRSPKSGILLSPVSIISTLNDAAWRKT